CQLDRAAAHKITSHGCFFLRLALNEASGDNTYRCFTFLCSAQTRREIGGYTGRILEGAEPADPPALQSTNCGIFIQGQMAKLLGLSVPPTLLARADEVIE